jgi:glucosamine-6-phosphate deaminase
VRVVVYRDAEELAAEAAELVRARIRAKPDLAMAAPAGRTPRRMYERLRGFQEASPVDYSRIRVFSVDELCPPAPVDGYFWRQVGQEFLSWAGVSRQQCHPFRLDEPDLDAMCEAYEQAIVAAGGLDLVVLGLGPNAHLASNEPGTPFTAATRAVDLLPETVVYIETDTVNHALAGGAVSGRAVTLGLATILAAREVVVLVSGAGKRAALGRMMDGPVTPEAPASVLRRHPRALVLADRQARPYPDMLRA